MIRADLHVHTYFSDGLISPETVAITARKNGLDAVAVTDHDNMVGCGEVRKELEKRGVISIDGIEISAYLGDIKIHTLGYGLNSECEEYNKFYKTLYENSLSRAEEIIYKLNKNGINLSLQDVFKERFSDKTPVHGMHIARAGAKKGYAENPYSFYMRYVGYGGCAYSESGRPEPEEAISVIKRANGVSSLAHPARIDMERNDLKAYIKHLQSAGLDGIEAVYSGHNNVDTAYFKGLAQDLGLFVTGGSDTHFLGGNRDIGFPEFYLSPKLEEKIVKR